MIMVDDNNNNKPRTWRNLCYSAIVIITVLLCSILCEGAPDSKSNADCSYNFTENRKVPMMFREECHEHYVAVSLYMNIYVASLTMFIRLEGFINLTDTTGGGRIFTDFNFNESVMYYDSIEIEILKKAKADHVPIQGNHMHGRPTLYLTMSTDGEWSHYDATFYFLEMPYTLRRMNLTSRSGTIEDHYFPNTHFTYRVVDEHKENWTGIEITGGEIKTSKEMDQYFILGMGNDIFKDRDHLPLYITEIMKTCMYSLKEESLVLLVTGEVPNVKNIVRIYWHPEDKATLPPTTANILHSTTASTSPSTTARTIHSTTSRTIHSTTASTSPSTTTSTVPPRTAIVLPITTPSTLPNIHEKIFSTTKESSLVTIQEFPVLLNASTICFYNYFDALKEFQSDDEKKFKVFRKKFVETAKELYKKDENIEHVDNLDETSVKLFVTPVENETFGALSVLIKVVHDRKSIFTQNQLDKIIEKFEQNDTNLVQGYKVGKCRDKGKDLPNKGKWTFLIYIFVPMIGLFTLAIWIWRKKIFKRKECEPLYDTLGSNKGPDETEM